MIKIAPAQEGGDCLKVVVQHNFRDKENSLILRTAGEELEVSEERARYLSERKLVTVMENQEGGDPASPEETEG